MTESRGIRVRRGTRQAWAKENSEKHLCQCGECGEFVTVRPEHYPNVPRYIHGHNGRVAPSRVKTWIAANQGKHKCQCGCEGTIKIIRAHHHVGIPRFISGHNLEGREVSDETREKMRQAQLNRDNHPWRGKKPSNYKGYTVMESGYIRIPVPGHPFGRGKSSYVMEHRLVVERHLRETDPESKWLVEVDGERYLDPKADVHHVDENKSNNTLDNLEVLAKGDHTRLHNPGEKGGRAAAIAKWDRMGR